MLLSKILKEMNFEDEYRIVSEKEFDFLALSESQLEKPNCTFTDTEKYISALSESVTMVLTTPEFSQKLVNDNFGLCITAYPRKLFFSIHNYLSSSDMYSYKRMNFDINIGSDCNISHLASLPEKNVKIGNNVIIEEFAVIRENTVIGNNTIIRSGAVIGSHGYEFKRDGGGILSVCHSGGTIIGNNVEIQYNTCIDRAIYPWDDTVIGDYTKIDDLTYIAHAVKVDQNVMICARAAVGGRTHIKNGAWIGIGATVINGITIGQNARANIGSVVTKSIPDNTAVSGNFAIEHSKFIKNLKSSL